MHGLGRARTGTAPTRAGRTGRGISLTGAGPLALGLRRSPVVGGWWVAVLVAGTAAAVAVPTQAPWHEIGLFPFDAAWAAPGLRLLSASPASAPEGIGARA